MTGFEYYEIRPAVEYDDATHSFIGTPQFSEEIGGNVSTPESAANEAKQFCADNGIDPDKVFWTIYGREGGIATAIGDFKSFDSAIEVLTKILTPMAQAANAVSNEDPCTAQSIIDDVIFQSSNNERL